MHRNVGPTERFIRLGIGTAAGAAAMALPRGWQRAALCSVSTAGFLTGLMRYCPMNAAMGIDRSSGSHTLTPYDERVRDTEIRRETQIRGAMGRLPSPTAQMPPIGAS